MKDTFLLPHILPNVFAISKSLTSSQFASLVLPSLKPLFALKEPPQNMLTLLENLTLLQEKSDKGVFRERAYGLVATSGKPYSYLLFSADVLPLVYNALESEHAIVGILV